MLARFSLHTDIAASLIRIRISGFYELPDIARLVAALRDEYARLHCAANQHLTLVDMRDMKIQPQTSVDGFQHLLKDPAWAARRIAFVVEPGLARAQAQRAANGRAAQYFTNTADAERWLLSDTPVVIGDPSIQPPLSAAMRHSMA